MINDLDISPFTTSEVRRFLSVWAPCALDELGIRKQELADCLERSITPHLGKALTPELQATLSKSLENAAKTFVNRHQDIRFTKCEIVITFGSFNLQVEIERSGLPVRTLRALPRVIQEELSPGHGKPGIFSVGSNRGEFVRVKDMLIVDDPHASYELDANASEIFAKYARQFGETDAELRARVQQNILNVSIKDRCVQTIEIDDTGDYFSIPVKPNAQSAAPARRKPSKEEMIAKMIRDLANRDYKDYGYAASAT